MFLFDFELPAEALAIALLERPELGQQALSKFGFQDSERALRNLEGLVGLGTSAPLPELLFRELAEVPDPDMALHNFERLGRTVYSPSAFFSQLKDRPETCQLLFQLLGSSQFMADILVRHPEYFYWLTESTDRLSRCYDASELAMSFEQISGKSLEHRLNALRRTLRRELLRIGAGDLVGQRQIGDVANELSALADICFQRLLDFLMPEPEARYGTPRNPDGSRATFVIIGLGKLGGRELNFSSDVDLMFVYSEEGQTDGGTDGQSVSNQVYFIRLSEQIVKAATEMTEEGFLYRTDMRLRPDGSVGALTMPLSAYERYYMRRGELWERQMLIKARPCAGSEALGNRFMEMIQPFVFPRHFEVSPVEEIHRIKGQIEDRIGRKGTRETHLKLRSGGIRDIEFIVQCLQLLVGRVHREARSGTTLEALGQLRAVSALTAEETEILREAYVFFRRLEHRLQMKHGLSDYMLPDSESDQAVIAKSLGCASVEAYRADLDRHLKGVQAIYLEVFVGAPEGDGRSVGVLCEVDVGDIDATTWLEQWGFARPEEAHRNLIFLAYGHAPRIRGTRARQNFMRLAPALMQALQDSADPDQGLSNLERLISAYGAGDTLFRILAASPGLRDILLSLCVGSQYLINLMVRDPGLLDWLTRPDVLLQDRTASDFEAELDARMERADTDDARMAALNAFRNRELLRIGARDLLELTETFETFKALSLLAETLLQKVYEVAYTRLTARFGVPQKADGIPAEFAVLGLGKMGGQELNFGSDLDLVFVYSDEGKTDGDSPRGNRQFFIDLAQQMTAMLEQNTAYGKLYPVDARLRPEGGSSPLALSYEAYDQYLQGRASTWERLALSRAQVVAGDMGFGRRLLDRFAQFVWGSGLSEAELDSLLSIRKRMQGKGGISGALSIKTGAGAIVDIEFIAQILQIQHRHIVLKVRSGNTLVCLERLQEAGVISDQEFRHLVDGFVFLRTVEKVMRRQDEQARTRLPSDERALTALARAMGFDTSGTFRKRLGQDMTRIREIFVRLVGQP
ncbi:MAG: hypothetical protein O7G87_09635 [bacterium]|nr:hypothetical protein [bacterium]